MSKIHVVVIDNRDYDAGEITNLVAFNDEVAAADLVNVLEATAKQFRKEIKKNSRNLHRITSDDPDSRTKFKENQELYAYNNKMVNDLYHNISFPYGINVSETDLRDHCTSFYLETIDLI